MSCPGELAHDQSSITATSRSQSTMQRVRIRCATAPAVTSTSRYSYVSMSIRGRMICCTEMPPMMTVRITSSAWNVPWSSTAALRAPGITDSA